MVVGLEELAIEIAPLDGATHGDDELANSRGGKLERNRATQYPAAGDR